LEKIRDKKFNDSEFKKMSQDNAQKITLNSIKDNKKFEINSVEVLYSLPVNSFTLINDDKNDIYLAKIKEFQNISLDEKKLLEYNDKQNSNIRNGMLKSYDLFLNNKYKVVLNQKTIDRVKNFFQ